MRSHEGYVEPDAARAYRNKHSRTLLRRMANRRELRAVARALRAFDAPIDRLLDCPCGAGRLVPTLIDHTKRVVAIDRSPAMVTEGRAVLAARPATEFVPLLVGSADALPFVDDAFDVTVCHRFLYHLPDVADRARSIAELARVTRRGLIVTYIDAASLKMRWRTFRKRKQSRVAWTYDALAAELAPFGLASAGRPIPIASPFSTIAIAAFAITARLPPAVF